MPGPQGTAVGTGSERQLSSMAPEALDGCPGAAAAEAERGSQGSTESQQAGPAAAGTAANTDNEWRVRPGASG